MADSGRQPDRKHSCGDGVRCGPCEARFGGHSLSIRVIMADPREHPPGDVELDARIQAQAHVYDAVNAEAVARFTLQHQLLLVAAALAGAAASFLPSLLSRHPVAGDFVLSAGAVLFMALATAYAEHDVFVALGQSFTHELKDFNRASFGVERNKALEYRGQRLGRSSRLRKQWAEGLMTISEYAITLGVSTAAAVGRISRGHLLSHGAEIPLYLAFLLLLFGFLTTSVVSIREHRRPANAGENGS